MLKSQRLLAPVLSLPLFAILQGHSPNVASAVTLAPSTARLCRTTDVNELAQTLLPPGDATATALPPLPPLEIPQQPDAVTVKQTLAVRLPEVIRLAFERSPNIKIAQLQLQRSCAQLREAEAALWPTLQTNGSISHTDNGNVAPASRFYNTDAFSEVQQQTFTALGQERAIAQQQFQQQLQILQQRFQQTATQVQTNTLQQQIQQLQQRASTTATLNTILDLAPFSASSVALPLSSTTLNSGTGNGSSFDAGLTLAYNLYTGGRRDASIRAAQFQVESSRLAITLQLQQLRQ
ncbi:MAG TPA: TolC family protein, partial [Stenomitos sp.]